MAEKEVMIQQTEVSGAYSQLIGNIGSLVANARDNVARQINTTMLDAYWQIGQYIVEYEQKGESKATSWDVEWADWTTRSPFTSRS